MKQRDLNSSTRDPFFSDSWISNQKHILFMLTAGGTIAVILWQILDKYYIEAIDSRLPWLRWGTILLFGTNLILALLRKSSKAIKQHLIAGFYLGAVFCMFLTMFTGASQSPYWFSLIFIIIAWFVLIPFSFIEIIIHSLLFVSLFISGQVLQTEYKIIHHEVGKIMFLYSGVLFVSFFAAYIRKRLDTENLRIKNESLQKQDELVKINSELKKFRLVLDQAPSAVFIMDKNWNFEYINPHFTKLSGFTSEELLHKNISDTLYRNVTGVPESRRNIIDKLLQGNDWSGELHTIHKNGTRYWANTIASPYKNNLGEIEGYIVIQQDITEKKQLELTLKEQENLYRSLIEKSLDGIVISQNGQVVLVNKAFADMLGFTIEECMQNFGPNSIAPEDRDRVLDIHYRRMKGEISDLQYSASILRKNGEKLVAEFNSTTVEFNQMPASLISIRDITQRITMQETIVKSEQKYKQLVENSLEGITIIRDNRILFANDTYCKMLGYTREELYNMPSVNTLHPDDHKKAFRIAERRNKRDFSTIHEVFRMVSKSGEIKECETASTLIEFEGTWASFFTSHDITEKKRMEEELIKSEEKYRTLIEKAMDGIIITQHGKLKFVNKAFCELIQYNEEELIDKPYLDYVVPDDHQLMNSYHKRRMAGEDFQSMYRSRIYKKDGSLLEVELNARTSEYNNEPSAFIIIRDITDRMKTEEELRKAKAELEQLNQNLEIRVKESTLKLTEANTQLIRLQKENLQSQFEVLRQQVNPHFLFNSLNVLTSLIKLEPDLAEQFTEHLSKVYRYVLENKDNDLVSLQTELDFLDAYIFLLNIRFMDKIMVKVDIRENKRECQILPLALQLLIENAIKHNSMSKKNPLKIEIFIDSDNVLHVENNLQERESHMASTGVGLRNIAHRYHLLEMPEPEFIKTETKFIARVPLKCQGEVTGKLPA